MGIRHRSDSKKGVLCMVQARKRGVLGTGQVKRGVFTAAHSTGHICECHPPPPSRDNRALMGRQPSGTVLESGRLLQTGVGGSKLVHSRRSTN